MSRKLPKLNALPTRPEHRAKPSELRSFEMRAEAGEATVYLYDVIDPYFGLGSADFRDQLEELGPVDRITLRVNSPGGSVFHAAAIYTLLVTHGAEVHVIVDGLAASAASLIAMAGDKISIGALAFFMVHDPLTVTIGNARQLREDADRLEKLAGPIIKVYAARTGLSEDQVGELMAEETWMDADESVAHGFADEVLDDAPVAVASIDPERFDFRSIPAKALAVVAAATQTQPPTQPKEKPVTQSSNNQVPKEPTAPQPATLAQLKEVCEGADNDFLIAQLDAGATAEAAGRAWTAELKKRLAERDEQLRAEKERIAKLEKQPTGDGVQPLPAGDGTAAAEGDDDPIVAWNEAVATKMRAGMTKQKAIRAVIGEDKELHEAYLAAWNERRRR